jgi:Uncharacterized conserved protein
MSTLDTYLFNLYKGPFSTVPFLVENPRGDLVQNIRFGYYGDMIMPLVDELNSFLEGEPWLRTMDFVRGALFPFEVKHNNEIENYNDSISLVNNYANGTRKRMPIPKNAQQQRIINLSKGYSHILKGESITAPNLAKLYSILSNGLLDPEDRLLPRHRYRHDDVEIHTSRILTAEPEHGVKTDNVDSMMDNLFDYINTPVDQDDMVATFIRSQLIHYQFVYIHPYFDVNGRTARTTGIWYLLNNEAFPFILFNRAIHYDKANYYKVIRETKKYKNATYFLNYMLSNVIGELEKEYVVKHIQESISSELSIEERQMLHYILTNRSIDSTLDLTDFYNRYNPKSSPQQVQKGMIEPLVDKGVVQITGYGKTKSDNAFLSLNPRVIIDNPKKIKRLDLSAKCAKRKD